MKIFTDKFKGLGSFTMWRKVTNFWSLIFFLAIIYDFFEDNVLAHNEILLAISAIYCASLAIYSAEKEFRRWHHMHSSIHPGEVYSIVWTGLILVLIITSIIFKIPYHMPPEVSAAYIAMISILAITRESKNFYKKNNLKKGK